MVQIYGDLDELAEFVAAYLAAGFEGGQPAVVVATEEHWGRFSERLTSLGEVLGPTQTGQVYALVGEQIREGRFPLPQLALMWVSANMPVRADRILASARSYYLAEPTPAG